MAHGHGNSFRFAGDPAVVAGHAPSSTKIEILEGPDAAANVAAAWMQLEQGGVASTPFQYYGVALACTAAHLQKGARPRIVVLRKDGEPRVIVPTVVTQLVGFPVIRFLGDPLIQYADVLACGDARHDELIMALHAAADPKVACLALFRRVREDAKVATALADLAREADVQCSPLVDLTRPSVLTARKAREHRRLRRRLADRGELGFRVLRKAEAQPWLAEALRLKRDWLASQGLASLVVGSPDWEKALHSICDEQSSQLVAAVLTCDNHLAAVEIAFVNATSWVGFIGAYAPEFAAHSPGVTLGDECMQWARDNGLLIYDQLPPAQHYKHLYATDAVTVRDYTMPLTQMAKLPLAMIRMIPSFKWMLAGLPDDLKRAVLKLSG